MAVETCYDRIARSSARPEEVGAFTLFVADAELGRPLYARPRLGLTAPVTPAEVRRVLDRQAELGVPQALEWVHEVTPSLLTSVRAAVTGAHELELCPLLVLPEHTALPAPGGSTRVLTCDDPDLPRTLGAVSAAFRGSDEVVSKHPGRRAEMVAQGHLVAVAAYDPSGAVVGGGSAAPRGGAAELMGIAVLPRARGQGLGSALTAALARACREAGASTLFLSAASDHAAAVYRGVGFERAGTSGILRTGGG